MLSCGARTLRRTRCETDRETRRGRIKLSETAMRRACKADRKMKNQLQPGSPDCNCISRWTLFSPRFAQELCVIDVENSRWIYDKKLLKWCEDECLNWFRLSSWLRIWSEIVASLASNLSKFLQLISPESTNSWRLFCLRAGATRWCCKVWTKVIYYIINLLMQPRRWEMSAHYECPPVLLRARLSACCVGPPLRFRTIYKNRRPSRHSFFIFAARFEIGASGGKLFPRRLGWGISSV